MAMAYHPMWSMTIRLGFFSPKQDIKYVKRYGATIENLKNLKQRVMDVFWNMHFLAR